MYQTMVHPLRGGYFDEEDLAKYSQSTHPMNSVYGSQCIHPMVKVSTVVVKASAMVGQSVCRSDRLSSDRS